MEIKHFASESDRNQSIALRKYVFHSKYTDQKSRDYNCLLNMADKIGAFENGSLLGQVLNLPIYLNLYGKNISAVGINHVGVYPESRGQGIASKLMIESLKSAKKHDQVLAILQPFSPAFYRHFGYDLFTERLNYKIPITRYPKFEKDSNIRVVRRVPGTLNNDEITQIKQSYQDFASLTQGMQIRDESWWIRYDLQYPDLNYALAYKESELVGYVSYRIVSTSMEVVDFIYSSNYVRRQLWGFLAAHQANVFEIVGVSSTNRQISYDFDDPRIEQKIWLDTMVRIIDVKQFLATWIKTQNNVSDSIKFSLVDKKAPWNTGTYKLTSKGIDFSSNDLGETSPLISIQDLTAIFLGPLNSDQLKQYLNPEPNSSLEKLIKMAEKKKISHFLGEF